jgi:SET domain-containing protein
MKRHQRLLVAKSTVPDGGWGLFTKYALKRGDFIHEYVGELISQDEADRRFLLYDKIGYNYLFDHSTEYVIDGMNKGSKARFANHSDHPNVKAKVLKVNGEARIGFFACENIEPQSEVSTAVYILLHICVFSALIVCVCPIL